MAIVRELITVLGTAVDTTGFKQYETGIARVKALALSVGAAFGLAFGADKIIEFAEGLVSAGKEINKLGSQLKVIARPFDDLDASQKRVFDTAQLLGTEYKQVLGTFKDFYNEMTETNIPIEKIEKTTENIFKSLQVARASPETINQTLEMFDRAFKRGGLRSVNVGQLSDWSKPALDIMKAYFKTNEDGLRDMAKAGELTAEALVAAFGSANAKLDKEWEKVPQKLGKVFTKIYNDLTVATAAIYKLTDASVFFGKVVWFVWSSFRDAIVSVVETLGGLANTIQLLGIALAVALGPWLLATLGSVVGLTLAWAAANALVILQWAGMALAVAAVAFAISDLVGWMQGKRSIIGSWVGPFKDLSENFKKLDIFSGFRMFDAAAKGDWDAFLKEWNIFKTDLPAEVLALTTVIATIGAAFVTIGPIIKGVLKGIIEGLVKTKVAAVATEAAVSAVGGGKGAAGAAAGAAANATTPKSGGFSSVLGIFARLLPLFLTGPAGGEDPQFSEDKNRAFIENRKANGPDLFDRFMGTIFNFFKENPNSNSGGVTTPIPVIPQTQVSPEGDSRSIFDLLGELGKRMYLGPEAIRNQSSAVPNMSPGAFNPNAGPRVQHTEINPSLTQNNSIRVETLLDSAQIGQAIQSQMNTFGEQLINGVARQINGAGPRADAATQ